MHFIFEDIAREFGAGALGRGLEYFGKGKVRSVARDGDTMLGEVTGSGANVYRQIIHIDADAGVAGFDGECSCPVGYNCKHVVAALLAALSQGLGVPSQPGALPASVEQWLGQLALTVAPPRENAARVPAFVANMRLIYVLLPDERTGALSLYAVKARLRKDGVIGQAKIHHDLPELLSVPPAYLGPQDEETLRLMIALRAGDKYNEPVRPGGRLGARLLGQLCAEGRLMAAHTADGLKRGGVWPVRPGPLRQAALAWQERDEDRESVKLCWRFGANDVVDHVLATEPLHYLDDGLLGEMALPPALAALAPAALQRLVDQAPVLRAGQRADMAARLAGQGLDRILPPPHVLQTRERRDLVPTPHLVLDSYLSRDRLGYQRRDYALLFFDYDGMRTEGVDEPVLRRVSGDTVDVVVRDLQAEREAAATLAGIGFRAAHAVSWLEELEDALELATPDAWIDFTRHALPRLRAAGWQIEIEEDYGYQLVEAQDWYAELDEEADGAGGWFALELGILVEGERHALLPLLVEMIRKAPHDFDAAALAARADDSEIIVDLPQGTRVILPWARVKPILAILGELYFSDRIGDTLRLPVADAARLAELEQAAQLRWLGGERLRELGRKLGQFDGVRPVALPAGLRATLRPYQQAGLEWMQFLREYGFNGILADDMGLGKTVQAIAHILAEKEAGRLDAPALVVAPTSLMGNWQAEAARFAPGLRVLLLHGKERGALFERIADADLVLTTYPLLGRDEQALRAQRYHLLILDEAQYIKNSRAKAAQVACLLDARHRLCLTGTPVQNHLGELWSQFHFLMPGLLGDEKSFNAGIRKPIELQGDTVRQAWLARRVKPFMLRRTKDKVATELPPKTEIELSVDFGSAQRDLYEIVRLAMDRKVRAEIERKGVARSQIVILDALLKLRQVCCDPRLLKPPGAAASAKLEALLELLDTLVSEGRKVLVFSQFTSMLALIGEALQARAVDFVTLTGDTVDRAAPVTAFQQGQVGVFLISLKAGGVGLNLTAADTVIHYDPWWNPATENQATDRAWRIGQEQPVFVYKLIARGTLEEKIQEMQRRKAELANALLDAEGGLAPVLGADDLQAIFAAAPSV